MHVCTCIYISPNTQTQHSIAVDDRDQYCGPHPRAWRSGARAVLAFVALGCGASALVGGSLSWHSLDIFGTHDLLCDFVFLFAQAGMFNLQKNCRNSISYRWYLRILFCISILLIQSRTCTCVCIQYITQTHQIWQNCADVTILSPPELSTLWTWIKQIAEGNSDRYCYRRHGQCEHILLLNVFIFVFKLRAYSNKPGNDCILLLSK